MKTIFESSVPGRKGLVAATPSKKCSDLLPANLLRKAKLNLPCLSELDVVRHFTRLSKLNYSVDSNFYPLGSCTMKYNPKFCEAIAGLDGLSSVHPFTAQMPNGFEMTQGCMEAIWDTESLLSEICGMDAFTMQPMAGAQGELAGALLVAAYHRKNGNAEKKRKVIIPDAAHGTNPASAVLAGYEVINIPSVDGVVDPDALDAVLDDSVAMLMMTCPNTLGLFERNLPKIVEKLRAVDALLYYDGANFNAIMGKMRIGDVGFDVVHLNLHKTMATPHGGGGPGSGPVGVSARLTPFLPGPRVKKESNGHFVWYEGEDSIGRMTPFYGHFGAYIKALAYIKRLGGDGLTRASEYAVLNANYMQKLLEKHLDVPYPRICMHEFVVSASRYEKFGIRALDIAKGILDKGYHAPTIYFPLIVKECLMFEPTETESKETLDDFCNDLIEILKVAESNPKALHDAPVSQTVRRLDELKAAKDQVLTDDHI